MLKFWISIFLFFPTYALAQSVKVGVILPLTGEAASYGVQFKSGIELSPEYSKFEVIYEDSRFDSNTALTAFRKLVESDKVSHVISFGGATCEVLNQEAQRIKIVHIAAGCNTAQFKDSMSYNFRLDVNESIAANESAKYLKAKQLNRVALVYVSNSWGESIISRTVEAFKANSIVATIDLPFKADATTDFNAIATRIRSSNSDAIFLISLPNSTAKLLEKFKSQHITIPIISNISVENPEVLRLAGSLADGISYLSVKPEPRSRSRYPLFYKKFPGGNPFAAWGFDSLLLLSLRSNQLSLAETLRGLSDFVGAFNAYKFTSFGELELPYEIRQIQNGRYVSVSGH